MCATISSCGAGEYESAAPTATSDRICSACTTCSGNEYVTLACSDGNGTNNRQCAPVTACSASEYQTAAPTATTDRACATLRACTSSEYETVAPTATSDRQCAPVTLCSGSEYELAAPTATSDRVCAEDTTSPTGISPTAADTSGTSSTEICDKGLAFELACIDKNACRDPGGPGWVVGDIHQPISTTKVGGVDYSLGQGYSWWQNEANKCALLALDEPILLGTYKGDPGFGKGSGAQTVSYTHLTLPTKA